ncbi:uncharacterized protein PRCAT00000293001 [Priceomyces carsonii]|uniref:uncharacterized protein n=1 Tax=Priceomyces carsonii TaxID=28549 RepID=UPI002EDB7CA5|nr:unnamed protein product [Priceomyces carsonii]
MTYQSFDVFNHAPLTPQKDHEEGSYFDKRQSSTEQEDERSGENVHNPTVSSLIKEETYHKSSDNLVVGL